MKKEIFFIAAFLLSGAGTSMISYAQNAYNQNPENQYPVQSGYQTNYNNSQNTGLNTRTVSQFQGQSPYRTQSVSNANIGTSGLSSFMRDSASTGSLSRYLSNNNASTSGNNYQTYLPPSQTVTSMPQAGTGISAYTTPSFNSGIPNGTNYPNNQNQPALSNQQGPIDISQSLANINERLNMLQQKLETGNYNSNSTYANNMQKYMTSSIGSNVTSSSELYSGIDERTSGSYLNNNTSLNPYQSGISSASARMDQPQYQSNSPTNTMLQQPSYDSLDQIKQKLDELFKSIDNDAPSQQNNTMQYEMPNTSQTVEQNTNFQSYSQSQFNMYFNTAQEQLREQKYYAAADSFTLASIYEPENPLCYAGQGHALFAAGQYVSSALNIIRAIEQNPDYIQTNIDLASITGGTSIIASRTAELEQLLKKAPATGLQFLLGYVYFRTARLTEARQIINIVYQEMSQSRAALALKIAIDTKLNNRN